MPSSTASGVCLLLPQHTAGPCTVFFWLINLMVEKTNEVTQSILPLGSTFNFLIQVVLKKGFHCLHGWLTSARLRQSPWNLAVKHTDKRMQTVKSFSLMPGQQVAKQRPQEHIMNQAFITGQRLWRRAPSCHNHPAPSAPWATQAVSWEPGQPHHSPKLMSCPRPLLPACKIHQQFTLLALQSCAFCFTLQHEPEVSFNAPSECIDSLLFTSCPSGFGHLNISHVFSVLQQISSASNEGDLKEGQRIAFAKDAL